MKNKWCSELVNQAFYDFDTAKFMFDGKRYIYVVYMCHLSIEKSFKALFFHRKNELAPKTHNLIFLIEELNLDLDPDLYKFIVKINQMNVLTRYPEDLLKLRNQFSKAITLKLLNSTESIIKWIQNQLSE